MFNMKSYLRSIGDFEGASHELDESVVEKEDLKEGIVEDLTLMENLNTVLDKIQKHSSLGNLSSELMKPKPNENDPYGFGEFCKYVQNKSATIVRAKNEAELDNMFLPMIQYLVNVMEQAYAIKFPQGKNAQASQQPQVSATQPGSMGFVQGQGGSNLNFTR